MKSLHRMFLPACLAVLLLVGGASAQQISKDVHRDAPKTLQAFRSVIAKASLATVRVQSDGKDAALGVVVEADGYVITKASELKGAITCKLKDGRTLDAKIVGVEKEHDLALLKIDAKQLPVVDWRPSKEAKVGKWVASAGIGDDPVAIGVVSVATRKFKNGDQPPKLSNEKSGYLGVGLEPGTEGGARVTQVQPGSPAAKIGLKKDDTIYEAGGRKILDQESLINAIARLKPGDEIKLKIKRGEEELELTPKLAPLPKGMAGNPQDRMGSILSNRRGGFPTILQHDTVIKPVDCGGPLVDLDGKVVGVNIARAGRTESYAIPSEEVIALLGDLKSGKLAPREDLTKIDPPLPPKDKSPAVLLKKEGKLADSDKEDKAKPGSRVQYCST